jgi:VWFA-related protein
MKPLKIILLVALFLLLSMDTLLTAQPEVVIRSPRKGAIWLGKKTVRFQLRDIEADEVRRVEVYVDGKLVKEFRDPPYSFGFNFGDDPKNRELKVVIRGVNDRILASRGVFSARMDDFQEVDVSQVVVPVVVTDRRGNYIDGLTKDDFSLTVDGKIHPISYFNRSGSSKFHMVLLIDISSSMKDKIMKVKEAAKIFLEELMTKSDNAIVVFFNHEVLEDTDFTNDIKELVSSLSVAFPFGATALYDAIAYCVRLLKGIPGQNIIVLFSDGEDNSSYIDPYTLMKRVERSNAVVYSIGRKTVEANGDKYQELLGQISTSSGGVTFFLDDPEEIKKVYLKIRKDIKAKYILQFSPSNQKHLNRFHKIGVRLKDKRYKVRTIKGFYY